MEQKHLVEPSAAHFDLDYIMHDARIRSPLELASAILTLDGGQGPYAFRFVGDARWQHRGFHFHDLRAARAFALCVQTHWAKKVPPQRCEVVGPDGERFSPSYSRIEKYA
jgi:hypothetical protein